LPTWLAEGGDDFEVALFTEAVYVRNLADRPFPGRLQSEDLGTTRRQLTEYLGNVLAEYRFIETDRLPNEEVSYLVERNSVSSEIIERKEGTGLFITDDESSWVSLNTSDHLRFRFAAGGSDVETVYRKARNLEEQLENILPFAFSERFGFLTARPTECGTGLFLRFTVHIPGILFSNNLPALRDSLLKAGSTIIPEVNPGISTEGHLFTVQTAHTLGIDEEEILEISQDMISELAEMEYHARDTLLSKAKYQIEDKILRGIGILTHARMIAEQEGYALANALRLGAAEGIASETLDLLAATELYLIGKPAHLIALGGKGNKLEMDTRRAELFRSYIKLEG